MTSAGVYLRLTGKILVLAGTVRRLGQKGRIPRPLVAVHSGKTATQLPGHSRKISEIGTSLASLGGERTGGIKACSIA